MDATDREIAYARRTLATFTLALRHYRENVAAAKLLARIALEVPMDTPMRGSRQVGRPADPRGVPIVGRGAQGAMRGTRPDQRW